MLHVRPDTPRFGGHRDEPKAFAKAVSCSFNASCGIFYGACLDRAYARKTPRAAQVAVDVLRYALSKGWDPEIVGERNFEEDIDRYESHVAEHMEA